MNDKNIKKLKGYDRTCEQIMSFQCKKSNIIE